MLSVESLVEYKNKRIKVIGLTVITSWQIHYFVHSANNLYWNDEYSLYIHISSMQHYSASDGNIQADLNIQIDVERGK